MVTPERLWQTIQQEAMQLRACETTLAHYLDQSLLQHKTLQEALAYIIASKLGNEIVTPREIETMAITCYQTNPTMIIDAVADLIAVYDLDPATTHYAMPLLFYKGFIALQSYRIAHELWQQGRKTLAFWFQSHISFLLNVDIHPAAVIGQGIMMDHATGIVIGETAVVGDHVSILQGVTLGGTGKEFGDRHPKVRSGVMLGAHATVLGAIEIGQNAKIGAGSVVLADVPANASVAGVPAKILRSST